MSRKEIWNKAKSYAYSVVDDKTDGDRMNKIMSAYLRGWCDCSNYVKSESSEKNS